jgi:hypothetical protein
MQDGQAEYEKDMCVVAFPANAIPGEQPAENQGNTYRITISHDPCLDLYPHTEVRFFNGSTRCVTEKHVPQTVKKIIRHRISEAVTTIWLPKRS